MGNLDFLLKSFITWTTGIGGKLKTFSSTFSSFVIGTITFALINNLDWITGSNFRVAKLCYTEIKPYNWLKQVTCFAIANETALF